MSFHRFCLPVLALAPLISPAADPRDWAEGSPGLPNGATRDFYNRAAVLSWKHFMGDWWDAEGQPQGEVAYATAHVADDDREKTVSWNVSGLVGEWFDETRKNQGLFLRAIGKSGNIVFLSREHGEAAKRPRLIIVGASGKTIEVEPEADTFLAKSTYRSQGQATELRVSGAPDHLLIRFDLEPVRKWEAITQATLELTSTRQYGAATIGVFRCGQGHGEPPSDPIRGLAHAFEKDAGIEGHKDVVFAADFDSSNWHESWTHAARMEVIDLVGDSTDADQAGLRHYESLHGKALRVRISKGSTSALNTLFKFAEETGKEEPEEIFFRYYLRLGDTWNQTVQGGKLPGISGTYGVAGWGGRKSDGTNGWSARGLFKMTIPDDNPLGGTTPIGTYCYHADMRGNYGTNWVWQKDYRGYLKRNRWYCVEQLVKLNTPGQWDGILRAWIDGRPAFEKTDIRFRLVDKLRIEQIWMNVYHGGTKPSPHDQHCFIDQVVVARSYIGPMATTPPEK